MKNIPSLFALVISLALIGFLYYRLSQTEEALRRAEQRFTDCEQVTFQLQMQNRGGSAVPTALPPAQKPAPKPRPQP